MPTFCISLLFALTWFVGYLLTPIAKHKREHTWADVIKIRFDRIEGIQFSLFCFLSALALVLFSLTEEDGNALTTYMIYLCVLFILAFGSLLFLVFYDVFIKPRFSPSAATRDKLSASTVSSPDSFSIASEGLPTGFV